MQKSQSTNDKDLVTLIWEGEKKQGIIKDVDTLLGTWQNLSTEEQIKKRDSLLYNLALLDTRDRKLCISKLAEGSIISQKEASQEIDKTRQALGLSDETERKNSQPICTAYFEGLVDIVEDNGASVFLVKEQDTLQILTQVKRDNHIYLPPAKEQIPWLLPRAEAVLDFYEIERTLGNGKADSLLYDSLLFYHKDISELPQEEYYDLIVAWDLHTYLLEQIKYSPIICLFAVPERGKTRTGQGMIYVAYRGIHVESLRDAYLVRAAHDLKATLFFDVRNIWRKAERNGTEDILLHRFERGAKVPRVLYPERGPHKDMVYYSIFGPTVISTNEGLHNILETRAIQINMPVTAKTFENDVFPELALPLKERLVSFRARHLGETLPDLLKPASSRLGDILKPLQQIIRLTRPEKETSFLKLAKELQEARLIEKTDSLEAQILKEIIGLKESVNKGALAVKDITEALNDGKPDKYQVSYQRVGRRLAAMGFRRTRTGPEGASAVILDEAFIERLKLTYGLQKTSETSENSEIPVLNLE